MFRDPDAAETPAQLAELRAQWAALAHEPLAWCPPEALIATVRDLATELLARTAPRGTRS